MSNQDSKIEEGLTGVPASGEEFSLEEILAEYGGSLPENRRFRRLPVPLLWKMWWGLR